METESSIKHVWQDSWRNISRSTAGLVHSSFRSELRVLNPLKSANYHTVGSAFGSRKKNTHTVRTSHYSRHAKIAETLLFKKKNQAQDGRKYTTTLPRVFLMPGTRPYCTDLEGGIFGTRHQATFTFHAGPTPEALGALSKLKVLWLQENKLTGERQVRMSPF